MTIRILEPEGFPEEALARLGCEGSVRLGPATGSDLDCEVLFVRLANRIDAEFHRAYPALKFIVTPTTGLNHVDLDHFAGSQVSVLSLKGRTEFLDHIHATAEHTIALALALLRDLPGATAAVRDGHWNRYPHKGRELHGKRVLILGYGRIGRLVAPLYEAFGCVIRAVDQVEGRVPASYSCTFPDALAQTDILSIHLPLEQTTKGFVSADMLARLSKAAIVVNTARGEVVDQEALIDALEEGRIAGAALDVLDDEPEPLTPGLRRRIERLGRKLVVTPHIGGFTYESLEQVESYMTDVFLDAVRLEAP